jgi:hypothetical protein
MSPPSQIAQTSKEVGISVLLNPIPTPQESFLLLFFKKEENLLLQLTPPKKEKAQP